MYKLFTFIEDVICSVTNRFTVVLVVVFFTLGAKATNRVYISGLVYEIDKTENVATLVRQDKELQGNIVVPGSVVYENVNYPVKLSHAAFGECVEITSVSLQCNAMFLPDLIFSGCSKLSHVELPKNLQIMGNGCFMNCITLSDIKLPTTLYGIGDQCFYGCCSLKDITLNNSLLVSAKCESLYDLECKDVKLHVPEGTAENYRKTIAWKNFDIVENNTMAIDHANNVDILVDVYSIRGIKLKSNVPLVSLRDILSPGIYIVNGKKLFIK